jgi:hypothetical protein
VSKPEIINKELWAKLCRSRLSLELLQENPGVFDPRASFRGQTESKSLNAALPDVPIKSRHTNAGSVDGEAIPPSTLNVPVAGIELRRIVKVLTAVMNAKGRDHVAT